MWVRVREPIELVLIHRAKNFLVDRSQARILSCEGSIKIFYIRWVTLEFMKSVQYFKQLLVDVFVFIAVL